MPAGGASCETGKQPSSWVVYALTPITRDTSVRKVTLSTQNRNSLPSTSNGQSVALRDNKRAFSLGPGDSSLGRKGQSQPPSNALLTLHVRFPSEVWSDLTTF